METRAQRRTQAEPGRLEGFCVGAVRWLSAALLLVLFWQSVSNTVVLLDRWEHNYFLSDAWYRHALVALAATTLACLAYRYRRGLLMWVRRARPYRVILAVYACALVGWVLVSQSTQWSDSRSVMQAAANIRMGNYADFEPGAYLDVFTNQKGLVLFFSLLSVVFGGNNYVAVEMLNAAAAVLACWAVYRLMLRACGNELAATLALLAVCLFYPLALYTSFTYGTLLGLALALWSMERLLGYLAERRWRQTICAGVLAALACALKSNYLVCCIAIGIVLLVDLLRARSLKALGALALLAASLVAVTALTDLGLSRMTDGRSEQARGVPYTFWIETGLQESACAPGWFEQATLDQYLGEDAQQTAAAARARVEERARDLRSDPPGALTFFSRKICSQWCEPTFQSLWLVRVRKSGVAEPSALMMQIQSPFSKLSRGLSALADLAQPLGYLGALLFVLLMGRRARLGSLVGLVAFIGGFGFHALWEAKAQYAMPYFVMLLPYAAYGFGLLARGLTRTAGRLARRERPIVSRRQAAALVAVALLTAAFVLIPALGDRWIRCASVQDIEQYTQARDAALQAGDSRE